MQILHTLCLSSLASFNANRVLRRALPPPIRRIISEPLGALPMITLYVSASSKTFHMLQYADAMVFLRASLHDKYHLATLLKLSLNRKDFIDDTGVMGLARCNIFNVVENPFTVRCFTNAIRSCFLGGRRTSLHR